MRLLALYRLAIHLGNPAVAADWVETLDRRATEGAALPGRAHESDQVKMRTLLEAALEKEWILNGGRSLKGRDDAARASAAALADALVESRLHDAPRNEGPQVRRLLIEPFLADWAGTDVEERKRLIREVLQVLSLRYLEELEVPACGDPLCLGHPALARQVATAPAAAASAAAA